MFESKTKSKQIEDETYFKWVLKYILENPFKAELVPEITDWEYSNAKDLFGLRNGNLTNVHEIKLFFQSEIIMKDFLVDKKIKNSYEI